MVVLYYIFLYSKTIFYIIFYFNMKIERAELEMTLIDKLRQKRKKYLFMWYNISEAIMYKLNG